MMYCAGLLSVYVAIFLVIVARSSVVVDPSVDLDSHDLPCDFD
jgi:hypothetical protein